MIDLALHFLVGLAIFVVLQGVRLISVERSVDDANARIDALERRLARGEGE